MKNKSRKINAKVALFWSIICLATLSFVVSLAILVIENIGYKDYNSLERKGLSITGNELFDLGLDEYYVYIYSSNDKSNINNSKQLELEPYIVNYFNFVKQNKRSKDGVCEIRLFDIEDKKNKSCVGTTTTTNANSFEEFKVSESSLPLLLHITIEEDNTEHGHHCHYTIYTNATSIKEALQKSVNSISKVVYFIPKKKEMTF